jgi:hypothetical protein
LLPPPEGKTFIVIPPFQRFHNGQLVSKVLTAKPSQDGNRQPGSTESRKIVAIRIKKREKVAFFNFTVVALPNTISVHWKPPQRNTRV